MLLTIILLFKRLQHNLRLHRSPPLVHPNSGLYLRSLFLNIITDLSTTPPTQYLEQEEVWLLLTRNKGKLAPTKEKREFGENRQLILDSIFS